MGAFASALAVLLGRTSIPLTPVSAVLGLVGLVLAAWLVVIARFFAHLEDPGPPTEAPRPRAEGRRPGT